MYLLGILKRNIPPTWTWLRYLGCFPYSNLQTASNFPSPWTSIISKFACLKKYWAQSLCCGGMICRKHFKWESLGVCWVPSILGMSAPSKDGAAKGIVGIMEDEMGAAFREEMVGKIFLQDIVDDVHVTGTILCYHACSPCGRIWRICKWWRQHEVFIYTHYSQYVKLYNIWYIVYISIYFYVYI